MLCRSLHGHSPTLRLVTCLSGSGRRLLTGGRVSPYKSGSVGTLSSELCAKANMCQRCQGGLIDLPGFAAFFAPLQYDSNDESPSPVTFEDVSTAMFRIRNGIKRTPCNRSHFLSELCGTSIYLKNEFSQFTGSFKVISLNAAWKLFGGLAVDLGRNKPPLAIPALRNVEPETPYCCSQRRRRKRALWPQVQVGPMIGNVSAHLSFISMSSCLVCIVSPWRYG